MRGRELALAGLVAVGCRGAATVEVPHASEPASSGEVAPVESASNERVATAPRPEPEEPSEVEDVAETDPEPPLLPPPLQAVTPVEPPFGRRAGVLLPVDDGSPVVLFDDEKAAIRRRVGTFLKKKGRRIVPVDELDRIEAAAAEGRLVLEGDLQCRAPLTHRELLHRYFGEHPRVDINAQCFDDCSLQVMASRGELDDWTMLYSYASGPVARPHDPAAWQKARLRHTNTLYGGIIGGVIGGSSHPPPIVFSAPVSIGPWGPGNDFDRLPTTSTAGCAHPDPQPEIEWEIRVAVAAAGSVERCEASSTHSRARPDDGACLCRAFEEREHPPGKAGRRFRVTATDRGFGQFSVFVLEPLQPGTEDWVARFRDAGTVVQCLEEHTPSSDFEATVVLGLRPDGEIHDVRVLGEIVEPAEIGLARCLVRELPKVPLPCAPPGIDTLQLRLGAERKP